eukprot:scaffold2879_cov269-Prasinococcus_capsulatus_cf.AAC.7
MSKGGPAPDLKKYMDKKLSRPLGVIATLRARCCAVKLNANRHVVGTLRGFDQFMNIVLDETVEEKSSHEKVDIGMVVRLFVCFVGARHASFARQPAARLSTQRLGDHDSLGVRDVQVIRGNSVVSMEALDRV